MEPMQCRVSGSSRRGVRRLTGVLEASGVKHACLVLAVPAVGGGGGGAGGGGGGGGVFVTLWLVVRRQQLTSNHGLSHPTRSVGASEQEEDEEEGVGQPGLQLPTQPSGPFSCLQAAVGGRTVRFEE